MALRKSLTKRLLDGFKNTSPSATLEHAPISAPPLQSVAPPGASKTKFHPEYLTLPDSAEKGFFRRFLPRRAVYHSAATRLPEFLSIPVGDKLREKLKGTNLAGDRLSLDSLIPPKPDPEAGALLDGISVNDAKKILRLSQMEKLKANLREIPKTSISYSEFVRICVESCKNEDQGAEFAKMMDQSGNVIVLGNVVFLRPEQVAKTMESLLSESIANPNDPRRKELEEMEKQKAVIDEKAKALVRVELYCGLSFLVLQTLGLMRLTFWELSWDVMEPICFFVTSLDFGLAYLFFLKTSAEPTFQGYFNCRFKAKQKQLMNTYNFDNNRYNELCRACYPNYNAFPTSNSNDASWSYAALRN